MHLSAVTQSLLAGLLAFSATASAASVFPNGNSDGLVRRGTPADGNAHHRAASGVKKAGARAYAAPTPTHAAAPAAAAGQGQLNAEQFTTIVNQVQDCTPYSNAGVSSFVSQFPVVWDTAQILPSDKQAQDVWQKIQASGIIPANIKPKGTDNGDRTGVNYDAAADPDCDWTAAKCTQPKHPNIPADIYTCPEPGTWGLTYDDGPNCSDVTFMNFLKQNNQKASLFYIGSNVLDWPLQAQRGVADGHHVSAHTWSHKYMTSLTDEQVFAELFYTVKAILFTTGVTVTQWRPPYGDVDDRVRAIATGLGLQTIGWSDDTSDWQIQPQGPKPTSVIEANYASIIAKATSPALQESGIVVLSHEINGNTIGEAIKQYPNIKSAFKHVVPVNVCQNITKPYQENVVFPDFSAYTQGNILASGLPSLLQIQAKAVQYNVGGSIINPNSNSSSGSGSSNGASAQAQSGSSPKSVSSAARALPSLWSIFSSTSVLAAASAFGLARLLLF